MTNLTDVSFGIAEAVKAKTKKFYKSLDEDGKDMYRELTALFVSQSLKLSATTEEDERQAIKKNIAHIKAGLNSLEGIGRIKAYNLVIKAVGDILGATIKGLL